MAEVIATVSFLVFSGLAVLFIADLPRLYRENRKFAKLRRALRRKDHG